MNEKIRLTQRSAGVVAEELLMMAVTKSAEVISQHLEFDAQRALTDSGYLDEFFRESKNVLTDSALDEQYVELLVKMAMYQGAGSIPEDRRGEFVDVVSDFTDRAGGLAMDEGNVIELARYMHWLPEFPNMKKTAQVSANDVVADFRVRLESGDEEANGLVQELTALSSREAAKLSLGHETLENVVLAAILVHADEESHGLIQSSFDGILHGREPRVFEEIREINLRNQNGG